MDVNQLKRGFVDSEYESRLLKAQKLMHQLQLDAILISTEANFQYFTGFHSQFWKSPTRPWFVLLPCEGKPIAVIPSIGYSGMLETWLEEVHVWDSPNPADDGVTLLASQINQLSKSHKRIGLPMGQESRLGFPLNDFDRLRDLVPHQWVDVSTSLHQIRSIKSPAEVEKIRAACFVTGVGFEMVAGHAQMGQTEREICKQMTLNLLQAGADSVPYLISGSGQGGYDSIIMGPSAKPLCEGDVLIIDTGTTFDGYYCDFCRNFSFGKASSEALRANDVVHQSIDVAFKIARPGIKTSDLFKAMWSVLEQGGALGNDVGRMGHGLGLELTEWPSHTPTDDTVLQAGMVLTLEPGMFYAPGKSLVHEEDILITEEGAQWITSRAAPGFVEIS